MKSYGVLSLVAPLISLVEAHNAFTTLYVDDVKQGDGTCVRTSHQSKTPTYPVIDYTSNDVTCGFDGNTPVAYTCPAPAGAKLTFEYRISPDNAGSGFIDPSHKGPAAVYAKQLSSPDAQASGDGWFKIWSEGYDAEADQWATEKLIDADGFLSIDIPEGLPAGNYLFRPEVIAMHNTTPSVEPQFYVGCAQVFIESSITGTLDIPADFGVSIPGYIQRGEDSMTYNIYDDEEFSNPKIPYPQPGPEVYIPAVSMAASGEVTTQSEGGVPANCLVKNANWCGVEVASYSDQTGCWAAVTECWSQADVCWDTAPITGGRNCDVWSTKCKDLDSQCTAGNYNGPPEFELVSADWPAPDSLPAAKNAGDAASTVVPTGTSVTSTAVPTTVPTTTAYEVLPTSDVAEATTSATFDAVPTTFSTFPTSDVVIQPTSTGGTTSEAQEPTTTTSKAPAPTHTHKCSRKRGHKRRHQHAGH